MAGWAECASEPDRLLRLTTRLIAYKKFEKAADLEKVPKLRKFDRIFNFCQFLQVVGGLQRTILRTFELLFSLNCQLFNWKDNSLLKAGLIT
jgi:hypothetical protein